jgi:hypothetical protein
VSRRYIHEAISEANRLGDEYPYICQQSSDYLSLVARLCACTRQWGRCQLFAYKALEVDHFAEQGHDDGGVVVDLHTRPTPAKSPPGGGRHWAETLFAFTAGCDLVLRILPESYNRNRVSERLLKILEWFNVALEMDSKSCAIGYEFKLEFLLLVSGYCPWPSRIQDRIRAELLDMKRHHLGRKRRLSEYRSIADRTNSMEEEDQPGEQDWVLQVDASEIGNEARYANHADIPNAILVKRCSAQCSACRKDGSMSCEYQYPHLVAMREIPKGTEITINYGASYWKSYTPGLDINMIGESIKEPFTDCIYYDGVIEDYQCSPNPGGFLIHPTRKRKRNDEFLQVRQVAEQHPAYPGFGLFAKKKFLKGDIICIYGGIIDMSPYSGRHASKYAVDLSSDVAMGPFGFHFDPITLECKRRQLVLPFISDFPDISEPCDPNVLLDSLDVIGDLGGSLTRKICKSLFSTGDQRENIREKLKLIETVQEHSTRKDADAWKAKVEKLFKNPFSPLPPGMVPPAQSNLVKKLDEPDDRNELIVLLGSD